MERLRAVAGHLLGAGAPPDGDATAAAASTTATADGDHRPQPLRLAAVAPKGFAGLVTALAPRQAATDPAVRRALREAVDEHGVLCLRFGVDLSDAEFRTVIEAFGPIKERVGMCRDGEVRPYTAASPDSGRIDTMINVLDTSRRADGSGGPGATRWHTDDSYCELPCAYTAVRQTETSNPHRDHDAHGCS